jgi:hypothetical protein
MGMNQSEFGEEYIIKVRGRLVCNLKDYIEGFSIETQGDQIVLTGSVVDHSALMGLLERLFILGLELDALERTIPPKSPLGGDDTIAIS